MSQLAVAIRNGERRPVVHTLDHPGDDEYQHHGDRQGELGQAAQQKPDPRSHAGAPCFAPGLAGPGTARRQRPGRVRRAGRPGRRTGPPECRSRRRAWLRARHPRPWPRGWMRPDPRPPTAAVSRASTRSSGQPTCAKPSIQAPSSRPQNTSGTPGRMGSSVPARPISTSAAATSQSRMSIAVPPSSESRRSPTASTRPGRKCELEYRYLAGRGADAAVERRRLAGTTPQSRQSVEGRIIHEPNDEDFLGGSRWGAPRPG